MARIEKQVNGDWNRVSVDLWMTDAELEVFERYRKMSEDHIKRFGQWKEGDEFNLDSAAVYIISEVLAGRGGFIDIKSHAFN